jgi:hypothetical protein
METVISGLEMLRRVGQKFGPYLLLEILLPGGSLMALLLFLYRRRKLQGGNGATQTMVALWRAIFSIVEQFFVLQSSCLRPLQVIHTDARSRMEAREGPRIRRYR